MTTSEASLFIRDRALSLRYEARTFRQTTPVARTWLKRAADWALRHGFRELADSLCSQAMEMREEDSHVLRHELSF